MATRKRSLAKSITYRLLAIVALLTVTLFITKNLSASLLITIGFQAIMTLVYFLHERVWDRIKWGK